MKWERLVCRSLEFMRCHFSSFSLNFSSVGSNVKEDIPLCEWSWILGKVLLLWHRANGVHEKIPTVMMASSSPLWFRNMESISRFEMGKHVESRWWWMARGYFKYCISSSKWSSSHRMMDRLASGENAFRRNAVSLRFIHNFCSARPCVVYGEVGAIRSVILWKCKNDLASARLP